MTPSKHSLERRIERLPDEDDQTTAALWRRFIDGEYDPVDPHPRIAGWRAASQKTRSEREHER